MGWAIRFGKAFWSALAPAPTFWVAVVTTGSLWWDSAFQFLAPYLPTRLYSWLFTIPSWVVPTGVALVGLIILLILRITPKIELYYSDTDSECAHQIGSEDRKLFRVKVSSLGSKGIYCSGYLTAVERDGINAGLLGPLPLTFAPGYIGKDALRKLIQPDVPAFLDIGYVGQQGQFCPASEFDPVRNTIILRTADMHIFDERGKYELKIVVTSDDAGSASIKLLLNLTNDWKTTTIEAPRSRIGSLFSICGPFVQILRRRDFCPVLRA
jgi:hypothetical protein